MKSPQTCKNLTDVREAIDAIDEKVLQLLTERQAYVHQAARFKTREQVVDKKRIDAIVEKVRAYADTHNVNPDMVEDVWRRMIEEFIRLEYQLLDDS
ncbi:MAG: chorismate mutase [Alphaproteobacteria bacterium GM202ARS2]|nr:chorismate mutase [Alphaproteobacteria bacterium GM202ARS2]